MMSRIESWMAVIAGVICCRSSTTSGCETGRGREREGERGRERREGEREEWGRERRERKRERRGVGKGRERDGEGSPVPRPTAPSCRHGYAGCGRPGYKASTCSVPMFIYFCYSMCAK